MPEREAAGESAKPGGARPARRTDVTSFRWRPEDEHAVDRVRTLLGVTSDVQAVRVALHHLMRSADACATPEAAKQLLAADVAAAQAVKPGPKPKPACEPRQMGAPTAGASINAAAA